jgi:hypothetical protein
MPWGTIAAEPTSERRCRLLLFELDDAKRYLSESMSRAFFGGQLDEAERRAHNLEDRVPEDPIAGR